MRRFIVVFFLFLLLMLTYIDRVCLSAGKDSIVAELNLSDNAMGLVFGAFALGYALAQIPSGWFADRAGPRIALAVVVAVWSVLIALTGAARSLVSLVACVFLFGIGEAGAYPGSFRAVCNWLPPVERGRANGVMFSGSRIGAAIAFPLLTWMQTRWRWRSSFQILGLAGMAWAIAWLLWFRNYPSTPLSQKGVQPKPGPGLGAILRSRPMVLAMIQYFAINFTFFICISWMLPYLRSHYHLSATRAASYAMVPLLACVPAQWLAGWVVDRIYDSPLRPWSRRLPGMIGLAVAAAGVIGLTQAVAPEAAVVCFTLAAFGVDMTISPSFVFCGDIAGAHVGSVSAAMNMFGNLGSFVSASAFPYLYGVTGSSTAYFCGAGLLNAAGVVCWYHMRSLDSAGPRETPQGVRVNASSRPTVNR